MNKKIVGFVLAMCLTLGLGVANSFGFDRFGHVGDVVATSSDGQLTGSEYTATISAGDLQKIQEQNDRISTMFGYAAGTMVFSINKNSLNFYDGDGLKVGFSIAKTPDGKLKYTLTSLNLTGSDIKYIQKAGGLKNFLLALGATEEDLQAPKTRSDGAFVNEAGDVVDSAEEAAMEEVGWLGIAETWLSLGKEDHTISINFEAEGGAQVTLCQDQKPQEVYGTLNGKAFLMTEYQYENGVLKRVVNAKIKAKPTKTNDDGTKGNSKGENKTTEYSIEYTVTVMDQYGREAYSYAAEGVYEGEGKNRRIKTDAFGNGIYKEIEYTKKKKVEGNDGSIYFEDDKDNTGSGHTVDYEYSANGSLISSTDHTSGQTTYYSNGKPSYVMYDGQVISNYFYSATGLLECIKNYNGGVATSMTVFDEFGRQMGSVSLTGDNWKLTVEEARKRIMNRLMHPDSTVDDGVQSITWYRDYVEYIKGQVGEAQAYKIFEAFGLSRQKIDFAYKNTRGYSSAMLSMSLSFGKKSGEEAAKYAGKAGSNVNVDEDTSVEYGEFEPYDSYEGEVDTVTYTTNIMAHGINIEQVEHTCAAGSVTKTTYYDPVTKGKQWSSEPTDKELEAAIEERGIDKNDKKAVAALKSELSQAKLEAMADRLGIDKNDEKAMEDLKYGFYTDENGRVISIQVVDSINMQGGSGFQPMDDEIIMVVVNDKIKNEVINNIKTTGDRSVVFASAVTEDTNGFKTVVYQEDWGYAVGQENVNKFVKAVENKDFDWVKKNEAINGPIQRAMFGDKTPNVDTMWKAIQAVASLANGNPNAFIETLKSVPPDQRDTVLKGVAAGLKAVGFSSSSLGRDWKTGVTVLTGSNNKKRTDVAKVLRDYLLQEEANF
ncbi:hypothetical protein [Candidatus Ruminimicrobium bovinum]|uniref:hypothetical protein n=1 Tax=Candidatus Ruminimicrobium bovinum TaxID=3242779 RepID=UPI0039B8CD94